MARKASICLFIYLLSLLLGSSSGTLGGLIYDARKINAVTSPDETISFLKQNKVPLSYIRVLVANYRVLKRFSNTDMHVDLYLSHTLAKNFRDHKPSAISWLKTLTSSPHVKIKTIIVSASSRHELSTLLSTLKSIHSILGGFNLQGRVKVSCSLSLAFLENSNQKHERYLRKVFQFISRARSFVVLKAGHEDELIMGDSLMESVLKRVNLATSFLRSNHVSLVLIVNSSFRSEKVAEFYCNVSGSLKRVTNIRGQGIVGLFAELSLKNDFKKREFVRDEGQRFPTYHRQLLGNSNTKTSKHDLVYPPTTTFPTTPITNPVTTPTFNPVTAPVTVPPDNAAPGIVTVPGMNPITVTPMPPSTPVPQPNTDPVNSPLPITNPVTTPSINPGTQPVTNPVTTYPAPSTGVPVTTPVTTPVTPPATGNAPALPGQSWCVAKSGAPQTALQSALDYACGTGVADCSVIQQSGSCYNPNTLQNHASYAFNSYYQKKPAQTSCDFGGAATLTNTNPSAGSCIYPSSSSSPSSIPTPASPTPVSPVPESPIPETPMPETPTPSTAANGGGTIPGSGPPPAVPNTSIPQPSAPIGFGDIPPSAYGASPPPSMNSTTAMSIRVQPFIGCIILVTSIVTGKFVLNI